MSEVTPLLKAQDPSYSGGGAGSKTSFRTSSENHQTNATVSHAHRNRIIRNGDLGQDPHSQFCALTGCPPSNAPPGFKYRMNERTLYGRAQAEASTQNWIYWFTATFTNFLLLAQIVLGALLTGLGGSHVPGYVISVIGAINTVIAGIITYLKSRGQPMRARAFRDDLDRIVDEIENSEVMWLGVAKGAHGYADIDTDEEVTVRSEVARLTQMLEEALMINTQNNPESYSNGKMATVGLGEGGMRDYVSGKARDVETAALSATDSGTSAARGGLSRSTSTFSPVTARTSSFTAHKKEEKSKDTPDTKTQDTSSGSKKKEDEDRKKEDEDKKRKEEEDKQKKDQEELERKAEEETKRKADEDAKRQKQEEDKRKEEAKKKAEEESKKAESKGKQTSGNTTTTTAFSSIGSFLPSITESRTEEHSSSSTTTSKKDQGENDKNGFGSGFSLTDN